MSIINLLLSHPLEGLIVTLCIVFAIGLHEAAHAYSAYWLGDITPKYQKRLTLNPLAHMDWIGLALIMFVGFGWGKPVEINALNLRDQKRDMALVAFAGPLSNIVLALLSLFVLSLMKVTNLQSDVLIQSLVIFITINISLAIFNLIPLEPLDGFKVLTGLLPHHLASQLEQVKTMSTYVLFFLILTGFVGQVIGPIIDIITNSLFSLI